MNFLILPTAEFVYYKRRLVELYGTAAAGVNLVRHTEKGLSEAGKAAARQTDLSTSFAYQINPIALRVGNDHIGGFLEAMDSPAFLCLYPKQGMVRRPERTGQASFLYDIPHQIGGALSCQLTKRASVSLGGLVRS